MVLKTFVFCWGGDSSPIRKIDDTGVSLFFLRRSGGHLGWRREVAGMTFRCLVTACVVGFMGIVANAEVLISEGCDTASDYAGATASGSGLLGSFPKAFTTSVGLAGGKWSGYGSQPRAFARTLPLPEGFESKGDACVGMNRGSNATAHRFRLPRQPTQVSWRMTDRGSA